MQQMSALHKRKLSDIPQEIESSESSLNLKNGKIVDPEETGTCCNFKDVDSSSLNPTWIPPSSESSASGHETAEPVFPPVSTLKLLQYASCWDIILTIIGLTAAAVSGLGFPAMNYLFGKMTHAFSCHGMKNTLNLEHSQESSSMNNETDLSLIPNITLIYNITPTEASNSWNMSFQCTNNNSKTIWTQCEHYIGDNFIPEVRQLAIALSVVGAIQFVLGYIMVSCLCMASENQILRIRCLFLKSFLRQDVAWFDTHRAGEFASRTSDDLEKLKHGIGDKIGLVMNNLVNTCFCGIHALIMGWKLSLVLLTLVPVVVIAQAILTKADSTFAMAMLNDYAKAGSIAEEVLTSIRTVVAFGGESKEVDRYHKNLRNARKSSIQRSIFIALGTSVQWFTVFAAYALGFWYGVKLIIDDSCEEDPTYVTSTVITVFFNITSASMFAPQLHPHLSAIAIARSAAAFPFHVIKRIPLIDSQSTAGVKPNQITGNIKFENVCFSYPSRPSVKILKNFNLEINRGETVALVGESGCGKSTTIQLIQRFYDVMEGSVKVDNFDIRHLNVGWLRKNIGVVGQEPVLFGLSILDNIRCGKADAPMEEVVSAAQQANAHEFIMELPQRYDTLVGEKGAQLSGGQKQRIAIARALVRNPKILLLDEATSALDTENEALVQQALEKASAGRTTVIVAHRLSTIINADKVIVISKGRIVEMGTHDQLMKMKTFYYQLVKRQVEKIDSNDDESDYTSEDEGVIITSGKKIVRDGLIKRNKSAKSIASKRASSVFYEKPITDIVEDDPQIKHSSLPRIMKMSSPEWKFIAIGMIGSIGLGFALPSLALIYGNVFRAFSYTDPDKALHEVYFGAELFLLVGLGVVIANTIQVVMFNISGENLTMRLRKLSFAAMLNQEMSWLDQETNSVGALCSKLSADASSVQGAVRSCAETLFHALCTLAIAVAVSLFLNLKMGLVSLSFMPFFVIALILQQKAQYGTLSFQSSSLERANAMAVEAISNLRTVTSFHLGEKIHKDYTVQLSEPYKSSMRTAHIRGLMYGFAICVHYFSTATCMYYGSILTSRNEIKFSKVLATVQLVTIGSYTTGTIMALASSYNSAMVSAERIFKLLDRKPKIDSSSPEGIRMAPEDEVNVSLKKVYFNYDNRPGATVLRGLDLNVPKGKCTALVGSSGCGKSTCIQLLERYYDPQDGQILIDGIDIRRYNIESLRSKIGIVSQEPILFDRSIRENIAYGDNSRKAKMDEIFIAARKANIHSFISTLPEGYETNVGDKGVQLSGGQKQRIAIARALLRNPHILLLDEATSALDAESEQIVQETLDEAQKGRTTIVIAHRLTTIKNADQIAVIYRGKVVEVGTHSELLERREYYYNLYQTNLGGSSGSN